MNTWIGGAVLLACTTMANAATPPQLQDLDATVERVRAQFDVPGIAVAVVKDGKVVLERGWGVREQGRPDPVQADTLFAIASNTKAFTATSLNLLAEDGKLKMDDKVIDHLPSFRMSDPFVTGQMTIRDLLSHRSGLSLGAGDLLFWPATAYSNAEVVERLGKVPLKGGFRESYAYDNILYAVAQQVIEHVSGMSYQQFLQTRIFDKVGMAGTRYNADHLRPGDKAAVGHAQYDFKDLRTVAPLTWSNNAGAGGIYSSAHDMARWMQVQLAEGALADGSPLFTAKSQQQMWRMITPQSIPAPSVPELAPARPNFAGYGEGWSLSDYRGQKLVWHTGGWPGMVSRLTLVPGEKLGVVVLTNQEVGAAFNAITLSVLDAYLGADKHDWVDAYAKAVAKGQDKADEAWAKHQAARVRGSTPSLPLAGYTGTFRDRWYGGMQISTEGKGLRLRFMKTAQLSGRLEHWQHDTFIVRWDDRSLNADAFVNISLDPDGKVREVRMQPISDLTDFSFDFQDLLFTPVN
ncbi:TPA: serine hydrolase [Stenotrophomonas maltophilia]|uniref:serine hydrolase n=1 Tax=Stenotrophomonas maltophilia TaxID=40324 RepID=UPI0013DD53CA|nr:serine hydrolase [Stenotrophomonas maltophilia]MBH1592449.1 serine hydrolase [Stenotrophomonas maltophilia]HEL3749308.1 serine hydrolase [Stenotrophomonas maltophilia]HEL7730324.1 serine hydrolase [Stenotrophomonas maltophilia]